MNKSTKKGNRLMALFKAGTGKYIKEQAHAINNLTKINNSRETLLLLNQMGQRKSIIHQGDAHVQKMNERKLLQLATFDNHDRILTQVWYDQLREHDDGSFSKVSCMKPDKNIDYQTQKPNYHDGIRSKILSPRI